MGIVIGAALGMVVLTSLLFVWELVPEWSSIYGRMHGREQRVWLFSSQWRLPSRMGWQVGILGGRKIRVVDRTQDLLVLGQASGRGFACIRLDVE